MKKADIYEQGYALLDRVSAERGQQYGFSEPNVHQLTHPYTIQLWRTRRPDGRWVPTTKPQRSFTIPAGWWEGLCGLTIDGKGIVPAWRTWSWNYERTRRKAERCLLLWLIRMAEHGEWP